MGEKYEGVVCTVLETLTAFSNFYGKNGELVLAGGGNTSAKDGNVLYIKGSGTSLATITPEGFVAMDRTKLAAMMEKEYPTEDAPREAAALAEDLALSLRSGEYGAEPFVLAADIAAAPGKEGRAGWSWYTGAAGWYLRLLRELYGEIP